MADSFGALLAAERRRRRLSQLELGLRAGVSQRHVSYLETGRSRPGRAALTKLLAALDLDHAGANRLLVAAGFAPARPLLGWGDPGFVEARHAIDLVLTRHEPFPGLVLDPAGDVLAETAGLGRLLDSAGLADAWERTRPGGPPNLFDLSFHPEGLITHLANPREVLSHALRQLVRAAAAHDVAAATLERIRAHPAAVRYAPVPHAVAPPQSSAVVAEEYVIGRRNVRLVSTTATFGSPEDPVAHDIRIELLFPADPATEVLLHELST